MTLECGFALNEPTGNSHQERWMISRQHQRGVDERIRLNQRAVEVDAKRWKKCCVESGVGDGQRESPSWIKPIIGQKLRCPATMRFSMMLLAKPSSDLIRHYQLF